MRRFFLKLILQIQWGNQATSCEFEDTSQVCLKVFVIFQKIWQLEEIGNKIAGVCHYNKKMKLIE